MMPLRLRAGIVTATVEVGMEVGSSRDGPGSMLELTTRLVLPAHPSSLRLGRHATLAWLQYAPQRYDKNTVLLLVTEVLAHALEHSNGPLVLTVGADAGQLRVEVADLAPAGSLSADDLGRVTEHSLRLKMTTLLADGWGVEIRLVDDDPPVRVLWFECRSLGASEGRVRRVTRSG